MEWEDDIGLNITVNPLDETKVSHLQSMLFHLIQFYFVLQKPIQSNNIENQSSDEDEYENNDRNHNEYSSEDDEVYENDQNRPKKLGHQLEWDDAAIEYGPKKV